MTTKATELTTVDADNIETLPTVQVEPMQMLGAALDRGMSVSDLGPLMDLVERDQANKARIAFMSAMADFQARCPTIRKTGKEAKGRYTYPELDEILRTIRPHLKACGLSVHFDTEITGELLLTATCYVMHRDGHTQSNQFTAPIDQTKSSSGNFIMNITQQHGSARSYAKRYSLMDGLNLVGSERDDDGAAAGTPTITDKQIIELNDDLGDESLQIDVPAFLKYMGVESVENIPAAKWPAAMKAIEKKREAVTQ